MNTTLPTAAPNPDPLTAQERAAIDNLRTHQEQADMDGTMVKVSRQAVDETLAAVDRLERDFLLIAREVARVRAALVSSPCPLPVSGDKTVEDCVKNGRCGCDNKGALKS